MARYTDRAYFAEALREELRLRGDLLHDPLACDRCGKRPPNPQCYRCRWAPPRRRQKNLEHGT